MTLLMPLSGRKTVFFSVERGKKILEQLRVLIPAFEGQCRHPWNGVLELLISAAVSEALGDVCAVKEEPPSLIAHVRAEAGDDGGVAPREVRVVKADKDDGPARARVVQHLPEELRHGQHCGLLFPVLGADEELDTGAAVRRVGELAQGASEHFDVTSGFPEIIQSEK